MSCRLRPRTMPPRKVRLRLAPSMRGTQSFVKIGLPASQGAVPVSFNRCVLLRDGKVQVRVVSGSAYSQGSMSSCVSRDVWPEKRMIPSRSMMSVCGMPITP